MHSPLMPPSSADRASAATQAVAGGQFRHTSMSPSNKSNPRTWPKKKAKNTLGHTEKEKQRRANIVASCNSFRALVPTTQEADKATVFRISVEYLQFLKSKIPMDLQERYDAEFLDVLSMRQSDPDSLRQSFDASGGSSRESSRPGKRENSVGEKAG